MMRGISNSIISILFFLWVASFGSCHMFGAGSPIFNVVDYGAVGDGKTDASMAFLRAWANLCQVAAVVPPTLLVPAGRIFLLKPVSFNGPCRSNNVHIHIQGSIIAPLKNDVRWGGEKDEWITFCNVNGLIVDGGGQIDGRGQAWWTNDNDGGSSRPSALAFHNCNGLQVTGLRHINSPKNHISINQCHGALISHLQIIAPEDSPNTDGIDISKSNHIFIQNSLIATGDDCIAINGLSSDINISGIKCGPGHGISVGSLGQDGAYDTVENVLVKNCTFTGTQNGVRIKTWKGGSGYARKITFENIIVIDTKNPIIIDQNYDPNFQFMTAQDQMFIDDHNFIGINGGRFSDVQVSDITYNGVYGSSASEKAITLDCCRTGCTNVKLQDVHITSAQPGQQIDSLCSNVQGTSISASPPVNCLTNLSF